MLKSILKHSSGTDKVRHRMIDPDVVSACSKSLSDINEDVLAILHEEKEEKLVQRAEMELRKGQNMIEHENEIFSRPARVWFQSGKAKEASQSKYPSISPISCYEKWTFV
jgi:ATP-dependent RNA helicase DDX27